MLTLFNDFAVFSSCCPYKTVNFNLAIAVFIVVIRNSPAQIDNIKINPDRHRIEVYQNSWDKVFIYILEGELSKNFRRPRTGVPYQVLDYTRIDDVENYFRTAFTCIFKPKDSAVECSASEINCQFLTNGNMCVCESSCTYQIR